MDEFAHDQVILLMYMDHEIPKDTQPKYLGLIELAFAITPFYHTPTFSIRSHFPYLYLGELGWWALLSSKLKVGVESSVVDPLANTSRVSIKTIGRVKRAFQC